VRRVRPGKLRACRGFLKIPCRDAASPPRFSQRSFGDHGISHAVDAAPCAVHRDLAIRAQPGSYRAAGARTIAIVNATSSPVADEAEFVVPIEAGREHSVAATKTVIGSMAAGAGLVAELAGDRALRSALDRLPERLHRALALDWSEIADDLAKASAVFVAARGLGLGSAREIALKLSEILRLPSIGLSAAELQHGPRAALSSRTPVVMMRLMDETAATVDALAEELREQKIALHLCGGPHGSLPWLAEDDPATDPITMLVPAYRMIEQTARACGFDPDRPPRLSKITETF
jgi:glucosamine--fructose-6-phosphate aminotransferase (isomerizing)